MVVSAVEDIMKYYIWCFSGYIFAGLIIFYITLCKIFNKKCMFSIICILSILTMATGIYFQAILADNGAPKINMWFNSLILILIVSIVLCLVQIKQHLKK